eukprot:2640476-Pyramimonas_sp.AAC.1
MSPAMASRAPDPEGLATMTCYFTLGHRPLTTHKASTYNASASQLNAGPGCKGHLSGGGLSRNSKREERDA